MNIVFTFCLEYVGELADLCEEAAVRDVPVIIGIVALPVSRRTTLLVNSGTRTQESMTALLRSRQKRNFKHET